MELLVGSIFYDNRWLLIKSNISLSILKKLQYITICLNFLQILILVYHQKVGLSSFKELNEEFYFAMMSFISLTLTVLILIKTSEIYYNELGFFFKAKKYDSDISIKPFEPIIRKRCLNSFIGMMYLIFSGFKAIVTFKSHFIEHFSGRLKNTVVSNVINKVSNSNINMINKTEAYDISKVMDYFYIDKITYLLFNVYRTVSNYSIVYMIGIVVMYILIKISFLIISQLSDDLTIKIMSIFGGRIPELDNNISKSRGKCLELERKIIRDCKDQTLIKNKVNSKEKKIN